MEVNYFMVSKPIRYLNIRNIPGFDKIPNKRLIVVGNFNKSENFCENIRRFDNVWDKIYYVENEHQAYFHLLSHKVSTIYTQVDCSLFMGLLHFVKRISVILVEEGCVTYGGSAENKHSMIRTLLGVGTTLGSSKFTKKIFVYSPYAFNKLLSPSCKVYPFSLPLPNFVTKNKKTFYKLFDYQNNLEFPSGKKILFYVTEWSINKDIIAYINEHSNNYDYIYVKPHPHIKNINYKFPDNWIIIQGNMMVEFIFSELLERSNQVTVIHNGSASMLYFTHFMNEILFDSQDADKQWIEQYKDIVKLIRNDE